MPDELTVSGLGFFGNRRVLWQTIQYAGPLITGNAQEILNTDL